MSLYMTTTADACVAVTVRDCLQGHKLVNYKDTSWEQLYYQTGVSLPRARIMLNPIRPLNLVVAVARFAWLVAGNNRVEDIAYYEPKVRGFSDDGLTVPGSDYGMRLFQPRPGLNQIQGVVDRLRDFPQSRQAAAVVWQPEDAVRQSNDIPCTFGMFFHIRGSVFPPGDLPTLQMSVNMRSNNAFRILPFNIFEFTMLQELVAAQLNMRCGYYHHWAASMHVYENEREWEATTAIAESGELNKLPDPILMDEMPRHHGGEKNTGSPFWQASLFAAYEARLRHACSQNDIMDVVDDANLKLDTYWLELLGVLVCWSMAKHQIADRDADPPYYIVNEDFRGIVQDNCQKAYEV